MRYESKKDWWLTLIVWGALLFAMGSGIYSLFTGSNNGADSIVPVIFSILFPLFIFWIWLTTYYVIDDRDLIVRYGPFRKIIPLNTIKHVKKTMNPLSSPALSLQRLEIGYGQHHYVLISPRNRDEFMMKLSEKCPQAKILV